VAVLQHEDLHSRINGRKGGRPPNSSEKHELKLLCKHLTPELLERARYLALHGEVQSTQLGAIALLMYGHGKPSQTVQGPEGPVVLQVTTDVNTSADFGNFRHHTS
jgi:hypothetical protein